MRLSLLLGFIFLLTGNLALNAQSSTKGCGEGATIELRKGNLEPGACSGDIEDSVLEFRARPFYMTYVVVAVDNNNNIAALSRNRKIDFATLPGGGYRVFGLFYSGLLLAEPGMNIDSDELGSICYGFTDNFIQINASSIDAGVISTADGLPKAVICENDPNSSSVVDFATTSEDPDYQYVITNLDQVVLDITTESSYDFGGKFLNDFLVYGLSYEGDLLLSIGDTLSNVVEFSTECNGISQNSIEVVVEQAEGGRLEFVNEETTAVICEEDIPVFDVQSFDASDNTSYVYVITGRNHAVLRTFFEPRIDFSDLPASQFRIYGVAYTGDLILEQDADIRNAAISTNCYDLSDNNLFVAIPNLETSQFSLANGDTEITLCRGGDNPTELTFSESELELQNKAYIVTDIDLNILEITRESTIDFRNYTQEELQVWCLAYTGELLAEEGDQADQIVFSNQCYQLSTQAVTVRQEFFQGGSVSIFGGTTEGFFCLDRALGETYLIDLQEMQGPLSGLVLTDNAGLIFDAVSGPFFSIERGWPASFRVYGLVYSGALSPVGLEDINNSQLASDCFVLSDNFIQFNSQRVFGGKVSLQGGSKSIDLCAMDGIPDDLVFEVDSAEFTADYRFVLTDANDEIIIELNGNSLDFDITMMGETRLYGVSYSGEWQASEGENLRSAILSDECYELSENYVTINSFELSGGQVAFDTGLTEAYICEAGESDFLGFTKNGAQGPNYAYLITDTENRVLAQVPEGIPYNFDDIDLDTIRVWGVAYIGELNDLVTNPLPVSQIEELATECAVLSLDFAAVFKTLPDAGALVFDDDTTEKTFCDQEEIKMVSFGPQGNSFDAYIFIVTDSLDIIRHLSVANVFNFSSLPSGAYRIWGLAYKGQLNISMGSFLHSGSLSSDCFDLTDTFLAVTIDAFSAGEVSLSDSAQTIFVCENSDSQVLDLMAANVIGVSYRYALLDENDVILSLSDQSSITVPLTDRNTYYVKGISYSGDLLVADGDTLSADQALSTECYAISENAVSIVYDPIEGGQLSVGGSMDDLSIDCNQSNEIISLAVNGQSGDEYVYILTNEANEVLRVQASPTFEMQDLPNGAYQLLGAAYNGALTLETSSVLNPNMISNACAKLSDNVIDLVIARTLAGTINLEDGATTRIICEGNLSNEISVQNNDAQGDAYAFLLTSPDGIIQAIEEQPDFQVTFGAVDTLFIYGIAYSGELNVIVGGSLERNIAEGCFELTPTPITLINETPSAGAFSYSDESNSQFLCPGVFEGSLTFTGPPGIAEDDFYLLLTNEDNELLYAEAGFSLNLTPDQNGVYRIWGLVTEGPLDVTLLEDVTTSPLSKTCFALTDNFVELTKQQPLGGQVATVGGSDLVYACPNQGVSNVLEFETLDTENTGSLAYLLTDEQNQIISVLASTFLDVDTLSGGNYRLWSVTYQGQFLAKPGDDAAQVNLSSTCYALSENWVEIVMQEPIGGQIAAIGYNGEKICLSNTDAFVVFEKNNASSQTDYTYLVTDDQNRFQYAVDESSNFDFVFEGSLNVFGVAYTGNLQIQLFEVVTEAQISDDCFALSDNFLTIIKDDIDGGRIFTDAVSEFAYVCPGDNMEDLVRFQNTSTSTEANYAYIVTTDENIIFTALEGNERNFDNIGAFRELRIWGVSYTGDFSIQPFTPLMESTLSNGCFELSENFVTIFRETPDGGSITTDIGDADLNLCPGALPDLLPLSNTSTSRAGYAYIILDANQVVNQIITNDQLSISGLAIGSYTLAGVSYTGNILALPGDTFNLSNSFSDNCFEFASNTIALHRGGAVDGGILSTPSGESVFYTCPFDGIGDLVFVNIPAAIPGTAYRLVITGTDNRILFPDLEGGVIPFDGATEGEYRVWGISYTGDYRGQFDLDVLNDPLSTDCYTTSSNYITVISATPEGGSISYGNDIGETPVVLTEGEDSTLSLLNGGASMAQYQYILTDENDLIQELIPGDQLNAAAVLAGVYKIYGLSYSGNLTALVGERIDTAQLADNCFDLSDNSLSLTIQSIGAFQIPSAPLAKNSNTHRLEQGVEIGIAPNPVVSFLNVQLDIPEGETLNRIDVYDLNGRQVLSRSYVAGEYISGNIELSVSDWENGMYILRVSGPTWIKQKKFIKAGR